MKRVLQYTEYVLRFLFQAQFVMCLKNCEANKITFTLLTATPVACGAIYELVQHEMIKANSNFAAAKIARGSEPDGVFPFSTFPVGGMRQNPVGSDELFRHTGAPEARSGSPLSSLSDEQFRAGSSRRVVRTRVCCGGKVGR